MTTPTPDPWRDMLDRQNAEMREWADRDMRARAGLDGGDSS